MADLPALAVKSSLTRLPLKNKVNGIPTRGKWT